VAPGEEECQWSADALRITLGGGDGGARSRGEGREGDADGAVLTRSPGGGEGGA
jgi:hypothetical protein